MYWLICVYIKKSKQEHLIECRILRPRPISNGMNPEHYLKELESLLHGAVQRLKEDMQNIRSSRPSVELLENVKVNYYEEWLTVKQMGSLGVQPPREITITVWDKGAVPTVMKAIEAAKIGYTVTNDDNVIRATLPPLTNERREEFSKVVKKATEQTRIQVRARRDEVNKRLKAAEDAKELSEDQLFKLKERVQKAVDETNKQIEGMLDGKIKELAE